MYFNIILMTRAIYVSIMSLFSFVAYNSCIDGNASCFLFRVLVYLIVRFKIGLLLF